MLEKMLHCVFSKWCRGRSGLSIRFFRDLLSTIALAANLLIYSLCVGLPVQFVLHHINILSRDNYGPYSHPLPSQVNQQLSGNIHIQPCDGLVTCPGCTPNSVVRLKALRHRKKNFKQVNEVCHETCFECSDV